MAWLTEDMNTWSKASRILGSHGTDPFHRFYLYRGQSNADWGLVDFFAPAPTRHHSYRRFAI